MPSEVIDVRPGDAADAALDAVQALLAGGRLEEALTQLAALHPADQAAVIAELEDEHQAALLPRIPHQAMAEILEYLEEEPRRHIIGQLEPAAIGPILDRVERDVAADVLHQLPPEQSRQALSAMRTATEVAPLLPHAD